MDEKPSRKRYVPSPEVADELQQKWQTVLKAYVGMIEVSEGARELGWSRNHFQTVMHRAMTAAIATLEPQPRGRRAKPERERELEEENARLKNELSRSQKEVASVTRILEVATSFVKSRSRAPRTKAETTVAPSESEEPDGPKGGADPGQLPAGPPRTAGTAGSEGNPLDDSPPGSSRRSGERRAGAVAGATVASDERGVARRVIGQEAEREARVKLEQVDALRREGLPVGPAVSAAQTTESTYWRWRAKSLRDQPLVQKRGPGPRADDPMVAAQVEDQVRQTHGLLGADTLRHVVPGASRRFCARVKDETLTALEYERKARLQRVEVAAPGIIRGMDQKYVLGREQVLLICADAQVPYRTTVTAPTAYDGAAVRYLLEEDIRRHGPPLVYRLDQATMHRVPAVLDLARSTHTLLLSGPPRWPQYYGQLERQNREHEAWLAAERPTAAALADASRRMLTLLNGIPRKSLDWQTAAQRWDNRPDVEGWREELWDEVQDRVARHRRCDEHRVRLEVERKAIEEALSSRGLLTVERGGWC
jgi:hypothetical protein